MADFASFKQAFHGDLVTPTDPDYAAAIARWAANSERRAAIVAFVKDADDVIAALRYAKAHGLPIAIRGGGHNPAGASSVEGGLVIDLSRYINGVRVDVEAKLVYVGGGALWRDVNAVLAKYGLATPCGTIGHTGVAGLVLGGGYSYITGQYGLVIDNLERVTIVLASGVVTTASAKENPDLFWGVQGGGSNFGVVTEFVLKLHPHAYDVFAGMLVFPPDALEEIVRIAEGQWDKGLHEKETFQITITKGPGGVPCIVVILFWDGPEAEAREHFRPFLKIGSLLMDTCKSMSWEQVNGFQDGEVPHGRNYYLKSASQPRPSLPTAIAVRDAVIAFTAEHPDMLIAYVFEFIPLAKVCSVPIEATAFRRSTRPGSVVSITYKDNTPEGLATVRKIAEKLTGLVAADGGDTWNVGYANWNSDAPTSIHPNETDVLLSQVQTEALFGVNHARLREIKAKYDPELTFAKWFAVLPKT